jgi:zeaxanthin glucosyltransferase
LEAQLVVALGRKGASTGEVLPGNPIIVDYAPQEQLLRRTALVISHGGLNTTLEALSEGVPQVVVPIANDQPGVAARMARLGIGEFIRFHQLTGATMREAVCRVMSTPSYRERSAHLAREVRRVNGPALAADLIETAFRSRQRVLRAPAAGSARLAKPTA